MKLWEIYYDMIDGISEEELNSEYIKKRLEGLEYFNRMFIPEEFKINPELNDFILDYDDGTTTNPKIGTYVVGVVFNIHPKKRSISIYTDRIKTGEETFISSIPNRFPDNYDEMAFLGFETKEDLDGFVVTLKLTFSGEYDILMKKGLPT